VPDWGVVAAGAPLDQPAAVVHANRVVVASAVARAEGVTPHQRRREAQGRCPDLLVLEHDPARDARAFEPLAAALDQITPRVEVVEPGLVAFPTRGPSRFFGGDDALAARAGAVVAAALRGRLGAAGDGTAAPPVLVGVADGLFAARLAAEAARAALAEPPRGAGIAAADDDADDDAADGDGDRAHRSGGLGVRVVPPGGSAAFLAPQPVATLDRPELVDVLVRLGLTTLGDLAALPLPDVVGRF